MTFFYQLNSSSNYFLLQNSIQIDLLLLFYAHTNFMYSFFHDLLIVLIVKMVQKNHVVTFLINLFLYVYEYFIHYDFF